MPIQHVNRTGETYYLHEGKTKTGKPKWFFSKKTVGELSDAIPAGYEIYENHKAQVFLRLIVPMLITKEEIYVVELGMRKWAATANLFVEAKGETIVVFVDRMPMLRFSLVDDQKRRFALERWCFRGSIDDWIPLSGYGDLPALVKKFAPHLGRESFFELM